MTVAKMLMQKMSVRKTISYTGISTNMKQVQRIYRILGWITSAMTKKEIIRSNKRLLRAEAPNSLWEMDMTYV